MKTIITVRSGKELDKNEYKNCHFKVEWRVEIQDKKFENCIFTICKDSQLLSLFNCDFEECAIEGLTLEEDMDNPFMTGLVMHDCEIDGLAITGNIYSIDINTSEVSNFSDRAISDTYTIEDCNIDYFFIYGKTKNLNLTNVNFMPLDVVFTKFKRIFQRTKIPNSTWDKEVFDSIICSRIRFDNVRVNPFYFTAKCSDKGSLDLSAATLIDKWSMLRKNYVGLRLWIIFFLTFVYFLPLLVQSYTLVILSKVELVNLPKIPLWKLLLFSHEEGLRASLHCVLTVVLLLYNFGRLWLTMNVSKLLEEQRFLNDANFNLVSIHPDKLTIHLFIHKGLNILFWISVGYSLLKLGQALFLYVPDIDSL